MIVMFGASSDVGRRATARLLDAGVALRLVARDCTGLDPRADHFAGDISDAPAAARDADVVVSCAHARFTQQILDATGSRAPTLILLGSAWRYSKVPEPRGLEVVNAEAALVQSGRNGVMLHPTMIYGGWQENNLRRLLNVIRRWPVLPIPGGGLNLVQPVFVEDVALCIVAAAMRVWQGPHVIPVCGPAPMHWRDMAKACASAMGHRRLMLPIPLGPAIRAVALAQAIGLGLPFDLNMLRRLQEDVTFPLQPMRDELGVEPRDFATGLAQMLVEDAG